MTEHVRTETRGSVLHVELNRPEKKNALTVEMYQALAEALATAEAEAGIRVVLISGAGDAFTAGNDLRDFLERPPTGEDSPVHRFLESLISARVPIVAAVHRLAVGIGTTLLLHCDLVYAARSARFHLPFTSLGLVPEAGSSLLLPQRIGYARAAEMLLLGEPLAAADAFAAGLVSGVFDDGALQEEAWARAERLAQLPPESVRATKSLMRDAYRQTLPEQMRREAAKFAERLRSDEARNAMQRFFEGRGG
ncbi:MAG: enoyl-CoA hydratase, partial [Gemmatimonadota bacterium]